MAVALLAIVLARTTAGRYMYAAGGNAEAARLAGVRVQLIKVVTFVLGGVLFIALIGNGFDLLGLNPLYEQITLGAILLIAVGIDAWSRLRTA